MIEITGTHHYGLTVTSIDISSRFYQDTLGFEKVFSWNPKADYISKLVGYKTVDLHGEILKLPCSNFFLELLEYKNIKNQHLEMSNGNIGSAHLALKVKGLEDIYTNLLASGVKFVSPPVTPTIGPNKGGKAVYMIDPDGFRIELIESAKNFSDFSMEKSRDDG